MVDKKATNLNKTTAGRFHQGIQSGIEIPVVLTGLSCDEFLTFVQEAGKFVITFQHFTKRERKNAQKMMPCVSFGGSRVIEKMVPRLSLLAP